MTWWVLLWRAGRFLLTGHRGEEFLRQARAAIKVLAAVLPLRWRDIAWRWHKIGEQATCRECGVMFRINLEWPNSYGADLGGKLVGLCPECHPKRRAGVKIDLEIRT